MPKLLPNGPDIPIELRQKLEEGKVVFFCGAGVSMPAGLPSFESLTEKTVEHFGKGNDPLIKSALAERKYDKVFNLLEQKGSGNFEPAVVREFVAKQLSAYDAENLSPHEALINLSLLDDSRVRLVTTNFDDLFERAYDKLFPDKKPYRPDVSPRLPTYGSLERIIHLHGWLGDPKDDEYANLILSSSDFGRAYIRDGWVSKYITNLFRQNYTIVFIGYGLEDPTMEYLLDALADDNYNSIFAFAANEVGDVDATTHKWKVKGNITPLIYGISDNDHSSLWDTIKKWNEIYQGKTRSKIALIQEYGKQIPDKLNEDDIENLIWALDDPNDRPREAFAKLEPAADINWLNVFDQNGLLKVTRSGQESIVNRYGYSEREMDHSAYQLCGWLVRHLDKVELLNWVINKGTILHPQLRWLISDQLENQNRRERKDKEIPLGLFKIWQLLISDDYIEAKIRPHIRDQYYIETVAPDSADALSLHRFLNLLKPIPNLVTGHSHDRSHFSGETEEEINNNPSRFVDFNFQFLNDNISYHLMESIKKIDDQTLVKMLHPLTDMLLKVMDYLSYFNKANETYDYSYIHIRSIEPHEQNKSYSGKTWELIIELIRPAIRLCKANDIQALEAIMMRWDQCHYPIFKRLILHAAIGGSGKISKIVFKNLKDKNVLWSSCCQREVMRLLRYAHESFNERQIQSLIKVIMKGPPKSIYKKMAAAEWQDRKGIDIYRRLRKFNSNEINLPLKARDHLKRLDEKYPEMYTGFEVKDQDEFPVYSYKSSDHIFRDRQKTAEQVRDMNPDQFAKYAEIYDQVDDSWQDLCHKDIKAAFEKLVALSKEKNVWPQDHWGILFSSAHQNMKIISDEKRAYEFDQDFAERLLAFIPLFPEDRLKRHYLARVIAEFIEFRTFKGQKTDDLYWNIWDQLWAIAIKDEATSSDALNSVSGNISKQLIYHIWNEKREANSEIPLAIKSRLEVIINTNGNEAKFGRYMLMSWLYYYYHIAPKWTEDRLIPLLSQQSNSKEWLYMWKGYMWMAQGHPDLFPKIKSSFFDLMDNLDEFQQIDKTIGFGNNLVNKVIDLFGYLSLFDLGISKEEAKAQLSNFNPDFLKIIARRMGDQLEDAKPERKKYIWESIIKPWFNHVWPEARRAKHSQVTAELAQLCLYGGEYFPDCVDTVYNYLGTIDKENPGDILYRMAEDNEDEGASVPSNYPEASLKLLDKIIKERPRWHNDSLKEILNIIIENAPDLKNDPRYQNLRDIAGD